MTQIWYFEPNERDEFDSMVAELDAMVANCTLEQEERQ